MFVLMLARTALAGCAADPDWQDRQAHAPLVAVGVVVGVEVVEEGDPADPFFTPTVYETVRVTRVLKGQLDHLGLRIRTWAPTTGSCGSARVLPVGAPVYVLVAPDAEGTVTMSACSGDVGLADRRDDLEVLAATHPETAGHFPGIDLPSPTGRPALPAKSGQRARVRRDGALVDAALLETVGAPDTIAALVDDAGLWFREEVPLHDLQPVTTGRTAVGVGSDLYWRPGVPFADPTHPVGAPALRVYAPLPQEALGDRWTVPTDDRVDGRWRVPAEQVVLRGARGGAPLIAVAPTPDLFVLDPGGTGWREIGVSSPELVGRAWVWGPLPVVDGGEIGGMFGGSGHLQEVHLGAGDTLRDPTTGAVFAECDGSCTVIALDDEDGRVLAAAKHLGQWWVGDVVRAE